MRFGIVATFLAVVSQIFVGALPSGPGNTTDVAGSDHHADGTNKSLDKRCGPVCIGIVSTVIAVIIGQISPTNIKGGMISFSKKENPLEWAYVRIYAGLPDGTDRQDPSTGGNAPEVILYDEFGGLWGASNPEGNINQGGFIDYQIEGKGHGGQRPAYATVTLGGKRDIDALCISAIDVIYPDSGNTMILGDIGQMCGWPYYPSISELDREEGKPHQPSCMWIDGNDSYNQGLPQTIAFHLRDFDGRNNRTVEAYKQNHKLLCGVQPRMAKYLFEPKEVPVFYPPLRYREDRNPGPNNIDMEYLTNPKYWMDTYGRVFPRANLEEADSPANTTQATAFSKNTSKYATMWVAARSKNPMHSAQGLCDATNSFGPDFVNLDEGKYCDMQTHKIWPLCSETVINACFDVDAAKFRGQNRTDVVTWQSTAVDVPVPQKHLKQRVDLIESS